MYRCHLISLVELIGAMLQVAHLVEQEVAVVMKAIVAGGTDPISGRGQVRLFWSHQTKYTPPAPKKKIISLFFYCWLSLYVIYHSIEKFSNSCSSIISVLSINGFELETEMR